MLLTLRHVPDYLALIRIDKPIGIFLLLWPTLWALWLSSEGMPDLSILFIFVIGVVLMRSAGCIVNDIADRKVDGLVERTKNRPLVTGRIKLSEALSLFVLLLCIAFVLVLFCNSLTISLAFIGAILAAVYPFLKRFTSLPQFGLGMAFAWAVPMAFAATSGRVAPVAWLVYAAAMLWPVIYDTMYAMADRADDIKVGIRSTAILFGHNVAVILGLMQVCFILLMLGIAKMFQLAWPFYLSLCIVAGLFVYHQYLIKDADPKACFKAFMHNNWVGLVIFLGIALSYI